MPSLEEVLEEVKNSWLIGKYVDCIYGTSKGGQRFAILITSVVWYALRVIMEEEYREYDRTWTERMDFDSWWIIREEYYTKDGVLEKARFYKRQLEEGEFAEIYKKLSPSVAAPRLRDMPRDCAKNPDKYIKPGDIVQTNFWLGTNHEGIYIGNGQVIHVSGHGEGKSSSVVRVGRLLGDFVHKEDDYIRVVVYRVRFQPPDAIVKCAKDWAEARFRAGEYNLLVKNCQHFARLCALGHEECGDIRKFKAGLAQTVIFLAFGALVFL